LQRGGSRGYTREPTNPGYTRPRSDHETKTKQVCLRTPSDPLSCAGAAQAIYTPRSPRTYSCDALRRISQSFVQKAVKILHTIQIRAYIRTPKIRNLNTHRLIQERVLRFDIAMRDACIVQVLDGRCELGSVIPRTRHRQGPRLMYQLLEVPIRR